VTLRPRLSVGFALFEAEWTARQRPPLGLDNIVYAADADMSFVTIEARPQGPRDERQFPGDGRRGSKSLSLKYSHDALPPRRDGCLASLRLRPVAKKFAHQEILEPRAVLQARR
jgi:hypothetical protein